MYHTSQLWHYLLGLYQYFEIPLGPHSGLTGLEWAPHLIQETRQASQCVSLVAEAVGQKAQEGAAWALLFHQGG